MGPTSGDANPIEGVEFAQVLGIEEALNCANKHGDFGPCDMSLWLAKATDFATARLREPHEQLTRDQIAALHLYTQDCQLHRTLNMRLRNGHSKKLRAYYPFIRLLLSALAQLPQVPPNTVVFRGVDLNLRGEYAVGTTKRWWAFSSCSFKVGSLNSFVGAAGVHTMFIISATVAYDISRYSAVGGEHEVLLPPGSSFSVASVHADGNKVLVQLKQQSQALILLPSFTKPEPVVVHPYGISPAQRAVFLSIQLALEDVSKYLFEKCAKMALEGFAGKTYVSAARELAALGDPSLKATGLLALSRCCGHSGTILFEGRPVNQKDLLLASIDEHPRARALLNMEGWLGGAKLATITVRDGRTLTRRQLLVEALARDRNCGPAYERLADMVDAEDAVRLSDGRVLTKRALYVEAIRCTPDRGYPYHCLAETVQPSVWVWLTDGQALDQRALRVEALRCDPDDADYLIALGESLSGSDTVELADGRTVSARDLFLAALRVEPNDHRALCHLGTRLGRSEGVTLPSGQFLKKRQLLIRAIDLDGNYARAYYELGCDLVREGETVTLRDQRKMDRVQLLAEAIRCKPSMAAAYVDIASTMADGERVELADGRVLSKRQMLIQAIHYAPDLGCAHRMLGLDLSDTERVTLKDGRLVNKRFLLTEALRHNPKDALVLCELGELVPHADTVTLRDGRRLTGQDLLVHALHYDPDDDRAYHLLALGLGPRETVTLLDGRTLTRRQLHIQALRNPLEPEWYVSLADDLENPRQEVKLTDGRRFNKRELLEYALYIDLGNSDAQEALDELIDSYGY